MLFRQCFGWRKRKALPCHQISIAFNDHVEKSRFEYLPNEIIFLILDYLNSCEIISAFINLNNRFQSLLSSYPCLHLSNCPQLTKSIFELMQRLPLNVENTKSLRLFCRPDSMIDVNEFLSIYPIDVFYAKLESLSLSVDEYVSYSVSFPLSNFQQLKHLSIYRKETYDVSMKFADEHILMNIILFKIKTLKYFKTNVPLPFNNANSEEKSPIEHFEYESLLLDHLRWFYIHAVNLKSMSIQHVIWSDNVYRSYAFEQLICLKLNNIYSIENIQCIFRLFRNLIRLKHLEFQEGVYLDYEPINGYQLENLIRQYVPQLRTLKFFFEYVVIHESMNIAELLASFQTDFWLIEKQWFITFISQVQPLNTLYYYTEPCVRCELKFTNSWTQITTAIETNNSNINQLTLYEINQEFLESLDHFNNIQSLTLNDIFSDVTYNELSRYVNISSIKHLHWKSETNFQLLFDMLKHNSNDMFLHISCAALSKIIQTTKSSILHFENIKSLEINFCNCRNYNFMKKPIRYLSSYFPNIQTLFIRALLTTSQLSYIIGSLKFLSFLVIYYPTPRFITEEYCIKRFGKKEILHRRSGLELYLWFE